MRRRTVAAIVCVIAAIVVLVVAWLAFSTDFFSVKDGRLRAGTRSYQGEQLADPPSPQSGAELALGSPMVADPAAALTPAQVEEAWQQVRDGASTNQWSAWGYVIDADSGEVLLDDGSQTGHAPASTMKLLTSLVTLNELDPEATLSTGTSLEGSTLYLWGEGDLLLGDGAGQSGVAGHAGLQDLAAQTAAALSQQGVTSVDLRYQDTLFGGGKRLEAWTPQEVTDYAGDVGPYAIDTGRASAGAWAFVDDSAADVAEVFAGLLQAQGITVSSTAAGTASTAASAQQLAKIQSAPIIQQVTEMLRTSDNTMAEQFCHLAAAQAGAQTDFASVTAFLVQKVAELGVNTEGMVVDDCSGLSVDSRVSAQQLVEVLKASVQQGSRAGSLIRLLPRAGIDGTLQERFELSDALGNVQAKTGSLEGVSSLAGVLTTDSGQTLIFAIGVAGNGEVNAYYSRPYLDGFLEQLIAGAA